MKFSLSLTKSQMPSKVLGNEGPPDDYTYCIAIYVHTYKSPSTVNVKLFAGPPSLPAMSFAKILSNKSCN